MKELRPKIKKIYSGGSAGDRVPLMRPKINERERERITSVRLACPP